MKDTQRMVIISMDALVYEDLELLNTMPNFSKFLKRASGVKRMRSVYPTVTYPAHASIVTGRTPGSHGIVNNEILRPGESNVPWQWFRNAMHGSDLFDAAKAAGKTTAGVFWPVTGNHPSIDYLVAEYWPQSESETICEAFRYAGSSEEVIQAAVEPYANGVRLRQHPSTDHFIVYSACQIIRSFKPELLAIHPANIDAYRHEAGLFNHKVNQALYESDAWLGQLMDAAMHAGVYDQTNFVVLSDHGQLDIKRVIHINTIFQKAGLIQTDEEGRALHWDAYCHSAGMSAQIYLSNPGDKQLEQKVYTLLTSMAEEGIYGISQVLTTHEARQREGLYGDFSFVIETDGYTSFGGNLAGSLISAADNSDYRLGRATHGYLPDKGPQPVLLAAGPAFKEGIMLESGSIMDNAPTLARAMGISFPKCDGQVLNAILKQ